MTRKVAKPEEPKEAKKVDEDGQPVVERPSQKQDDGAKVIPLRRMG